MSHQLNARAAGFDPERREKGLHRFSVALSILLAGIASAAHSQQSPPGPVAIPVGSVAENYLRYAQTIGEIPLTSWTIRPLTPPQIARTSVDTAWQRRLNPAAGRIGGLAWQRLPVVGTMWYNSTYPFGWNDGAVWRGRGATTAIEAGASISWKFFSATLNPLGFVAQNRAFPLMTPPGARVNPFSDPQLPTKIDRPQRFGDDTYARLHPGQSSVRVDALGFSVGASTSNMWFGPMSEWPYTLGNNAPGFPHAFAGSSSPWNIGIGRIHGRVFYGRLGESPYSNVPDSGSSRVISGLAGSFFPRFIPGLEIGGARTFNYYWPRNGFSESDLRKPLEGLLKEKLQGNIIDPSNPNQSSDNQIASLFARWVLPSSGIEIYGEYGRDDHSWNGLDAILEPDHSATFGLGIRKAWRDSRKGLAAVRAEMMNFEPSTLSRQRPAGTGDLYAHNFTRQGHTAQGQVLGIGFGAIAGAGSMIAFERFDVNGDHSSLSLTRMIVRERAADPSIDVMYALGAERERRIGRVRVLYGVTAVYELNRYFTADVGNVMTTLGLKW